MSRVLFTKQNTNYKPKLGRSRELGGSLRRERHGFVSRAQITAMPGQGGTAAALPGGVLQLRALATSKDLDNRFRAVESTQDRPYRYSGH